MWSLKRISLRAQKNFNHKKAINTKKLGRGENIYRLTLSNGVSIW